MPLLTTIVPAKRCSLAKQRLAGVLNAEERLVLAMTMFHDVLGALRSLHPDTHILVVTADQNLAAIADAYDVEVMPDIWEQGVTRAVREAATRLSDRGFNAAMIVPADVPLVQSNELRTLLQAHAAQRVTIVPADIDQGTNALVVPLPTPIEFAYGPGSFLRHLDQARDARIATRVMRIPGLNLDVDRPSDLIRVLVSNRATRTKAYLSTLDSKRFDDTCLAGHSVRVVQLDCLTGLPDKKRST